MPVPEDQNEPEFKYQISDILLYQGYRVRILNRDPSFGRPRYLMEHVKEKPSYPCKDNWWDFENNLKPLLEEEEKRQSPSDSLSVPGDFKYAISEIVMYCGYKVKIVSRSISAPGPHNYMVEYADERFRDLGDYEAFKVMENDLSKYEAVISKFKIGDRVKNKEGEIWDIIRIYPLRDVPTEFVYDVISPDRENHGSFYGHNLTSATEKTIAYALPDAVNNPSHYKSLGAVCECGRTLECLDVTRHLNFNLGNAIKYIWRCEHKGKRVEDLKKAVFYLEDEIKRQEG